MSDSTKQKEVLVCGFDAAERIESILREFGSELVMCRVTTKDELITELAKGQQQICVIEHLVPTIDAVKVWNQLHKKMGLSQGLFHITGLLSAGLISKRQETLPVPMTAYDLLPELVVKSPGTKFVITSHTRGSGLSPEQRASYKERQEVLKVMGFVNSTANYHYLAKLFSECIMTELGNPDQPPNQSPEPRPLPMRQRSIGMILALMKRLTHGSNKILTASNFSTTCRMSAQHVNSS